MTNKRQAARLRAVRWMKGILIAGSVAASLLGTELLAKQEQPAPAPTQVIPTQTKQNPVWQQAPAGRTLQLNPIPTAAAPLRPITRSRSSR